jgi:hypothetical protein
MSGRMPYGTNRAPTTRTDPDGLTAAACVS